MSKKLRCWHISDTHGYHDLLRVPDNIDLVIFTGDCSNYKDPIRNEKEVRKFITYYSSLPIKYKIFIPGNHETSIEYGLVTRDNFELAGIKYLENESVEIEGIKIWGSPFTPKFFNWAFMKERDKLGDIWNLIPEDVDILAVHGPPRGVLDIGYNYQKDEIEYCGCKLLKEKCLQLNPKYMLFGHIHNNGDICNAGRVVLSESDTIYSNATAVTDNNFKQGITYHGFVFDI